MSSPIMPTHLIYHTFRSINTPHNHRFTHSHTSFHSIEVSKRLRVQSYLQRKVKQGMTLSLRYLNTNTFKHSLGIHPQTHFLIQTPLICILTHISSTITAIRKKQKSTHDKEIEKVTHNPSVAYFELLKANPSKHYYYDTPTNLALSFPRSFDEILQASDEDFIDYREKPVKKELTPGTHSTTRTPNIT